MKKLSTLSAVTFAVSLVCLTAVLTLSTARAGSPMMYQASDPVLAGAFNKYVILTGAVGNGTSGTIYTVPAGKRLVIEQIFGRCMPPAGQAAAGLYQVGSSGTVVDLELHSQGANQGFEQYSFNHRVRLYAEAGSNVMVQFSKSSSTGAMNARAGISGYLVNFP